MRDPAPRLTQSTPLVEASKVVRQTSGLAPPRSQVMLEPSEVRLCVAGSVLISRPMFVRATPPSIAKLPPARIAPSP